jgi:hypothetical protein
MDRPFYLFVGAAAMIGFGTVWMATGVADTPPPVPVVVAPPPMPTGPAHPDAASPLTIPVHVEGGGSSLSGNAPMAPLDPGTAAVQPTPASGRTEATTAAPPLPSQPVVTYAPVPAPPPADTGGQAPPSLPAVQ